MLVLTYWVLLWPHICRSSLAKNDLHTKSDESVKTAYNISFRYYNSPHSHQWESCLVRMIVLPHLYLNHQYGMCSSSTFVKFWKKIVHNVFKYCACGICISLYFNQVLPRLQYSPHLHVFVLNSHAHIPTTWISFLASQFFAASCLINGCK